MDISFNERIAFEIMALVGKNLLNSVKNRGENRVFNWLKNLLNLMRKRGKKSGKIESSINEKPSKLNEETWKKINHLILCTLLCKSKKSPKHS